MSVEELYQLFPKDPATTAVKIAGIPRPRDPWKGSTRP
nr:TusE/DsrC/DsvC family sulfur relay protein [Streptomyces sp. cf386]